MHHLENTETNFQSVIGSWNATRCRVEKRCSKKIKKEKAGIGIGGTRPVTYGGLKTWKRPAIRNTTSTDYTVR